jgi:hypothetical protein
MTSKSDSAQDVPLILITIAIRPILEQFSISMTPKTIVDKTQLPLGSMPSVTLAAFVHT